MRIRRLAALMALAVAAALLVSACGSSDDDSGSSSTPATTTGGDTTTTELTGDPYVIGGLTPLSGEGYNYPDWVAGGEAAAEAINASGGINGRPVEYWNCDDKNNPNEAAKCAREMVSKDVIAVAGGASLFAENITPILREAEIPWVGAFAESEEQWNADNEFPVDSGHFQSGAGSALALKEAGLKSGAQGHFDVPNSTVHFEAFENALEAMGLDNKGGVSFPITTTDMTPYVQKMIQIDPEGVGMFGLQQLVVNFMKTGNQLGADWTYATSDGALKPEDYQAVGSYTAYTSGGLPPITAGETDPDKYPGVVEFREDMDNAAANGNKYAGEQYLGYHSLRTWFSTIVVAQIANEALKDQDVTAPEVTKALNAAKDIETGVIPPWTPGANDGPAGYKRLSNPFIYISKVNEEGKPILDQNEPINLIEAADIE